MPSLTKYGVNYKFFKLLGSGERLCLHKQRYFSVLFSSASNSFSNLNFRLPQQAHQGEVLSPPMQTFHPARVRILPKIVLERSRAANVTVQLTLEDSPLMMQGQNH